MKDLKSIAEAYVRMKMGEFESFSESYEITESNVAQTIYTQLKQMNPNTWFSWGPKDLVAMDDGLKFKTSGIMPWKGYVYVQYDKGRDLYNVSFGQIRNYQWVERDRIDGVQFDQLHDIIDSRVTKRMSKWPKKGRVVNESRNSSKKPLPPNLVRQIERNAENERRGGGTVEIDHRIPTIAVTTSAGEEYFFQGHEAENLLDEVPENVDEEDFILYSSQGW